MKQNASGAGSYRNFSHSRTLKGRSVIHRHEFHCMNTKILLGFLCSFIVMVLATLSIWHAVTTNIDAKGGIMHDKLYSMSMAMRHSHIAQNSRRLSHHRLWTSVTGKDIQRNVHIDIYVFLGYIGEETRESIIKILNGTTVVFNSAQFIELLNERASDTYTLNAYIVQFYRTKIYDPLQQDIIKVSKATDMNNMDYEEIYNICGTDDDKVGKEMSMASASLIAQIWLNEEAWRENDIVYDVVFHQKDGSVMAQYLQFDNGDFCQSPKWANALFNTLTPSPKTHNAEEYWSKDKSFCSDVTLKSCKDAPFCACVESHLDVIKFPN